MTSLPIFLQADQPSLTAAGYPATFFSAPTDALRGAILSVGTDAQLLASRAGIFGLTGCHVVSLYPGQAVDYTPAHALRLVVICHTVSDEQAAEIALHTRASHPETRLMATTRDPRPSAVSSLFDLVLESGRGPSTLLAGALKLLDGREYRSNA